MDSEHSHHHHPLLQSNWADYVTGNYGDSVEFVIDKSMPRPVRRLVRQVVQEIDEIIGTPTTVKARNPWKRCIGFGGAEADIFLTDKAPSEAWDKHNPIGLNVGDTRGLSWATEDCNGMLSSASWATDLYNTSQSRRTNGKLKTNYGLNETTEHVITHEILHTLGLSHPNNNGHESGFTWKESAMSYNWGPVPEQGHITALDREALALLWG